MFFEIYEGMKLLSLDPNGEWRWRLRTKNGKIMADSGEAYSSRSGVKRAIRRILDEFGGSTDVEIRDAD